MIPPYFDLVECKQFVRRFATMLDTQLICYKHYSLWVDAVITALDSPPHWLLEICTIKYQPEASQTVRAYAYSEPLQEFNLINLSDDHVACFFLRQQSGATSWATFLHDAGCHVDGNDGRVCCEYFFCMLNALEDSEYDQQITVDQQSRVREDYSDAIDRIQSLYNVFLGYFRKHGNTVA